jgi:hypothetical protein
VKEYIEGAMPIFSVGEYWDSCNYNDDGLDYNQGMVHSCLSWTKILIALSLKRK